MDQRLGLGGSAAFVGIVVAILAGTRLAPRPEPGSATAGKAAASAELEEASQRALAAKEPADLLERPVDEIRAFFGRRISKKAPAKSEPADVVKEVRRCLDCASPAEPPPRPISSLADEIRTMARDHSYELRFLVAIASDPLDSFAGGQFDGCVTALLRGAAASAWLPDRYWFPWRSAGTGTTTTDDSDDPAARHRSSPGIALFRSADARTLLVVFVIGESPLTGIQKQPFLGALQLIAAIDQKAEIQVLGPFSSGAARSCALALEEWCRTTAEPRPESILFRSGSATRPKLEERLQPMRCDHCPTVRFDRAVVSDDLMQQTAFDFFQNHLGWRTSEIALLHESDTSYGATRRAPAEGETDETKGAAKGALGEMDGTTKASSPWKLDFPVPSALSGVRTASETSRKTDDVQIGGVKLPAYALELQLTDTRAPRDVFPEFSSMTARVDERELDSLLSTLSRERIRHLGLIFTDVRDKLFLAEKIKELAPHVSLFTFESSVLYVHPRFNVSTDGMLVISSYPLSMVPQQLMSGRTDSLRNQFGSDTEEGLYNATVVTLSESPSTLVEDYVTIPGAHVRAPAVWISAVGDGRLVPLTVVSPYSLRNLASAEPILVAPLPLASKIPPAGALKHPQHSPELRTMVRRLRVPAGFRYLFWAASVAFLFLIAAFGLGFCEFAGKPIVQLRRWIPGFFLPLEPRDDGDDDDDKQRHSKADRQHRRWVLAFVVGAAMLWVAIATVYIVPSVLRQGYGVSRQHTLDLLHGNWFLSVEDAVLGSTVKQLGLVALFLVILLGGLGWVIQSHGGKPGGWIAAVVLALAMTGALLVSQRALEVVRCDRHGPASESRVEGAIFTYLRASSAPGNLSPLAGPIMLTTGVAFLVAFQLTRLHMNNGWACRLPTDALKNSRDLALRDLDTLQKHLEGRILKAAPRSPFFWAVGLVLLFPLLVTLFLQFEAACDSLLWSKAFAFLFSFVLLPATLAAFTRCVSLWRGLQRLLTRQEWSDIVPALEACRGQLQSPVLKVWGATRRNSYSTLILSVKKLHGLSRHRDLSAYGDATALQQESTDAEKALTEALQTRNKRRVQSERSARIKIVVALEKAAQNAQEALNQLDANPGRGPRKLRDQVTEFLALRAIAYFRYVMAQIRNSLLAFTVGILFLLAGLASFHFQPLRSVYVVLWSVIGVVAIWTAVIFVQMDRNVVLSKIDGTTPGEFNPIKSGSLLRLAAFTLPPVLVLIVTQFPQIGQPLVGWLNPLLRLFQ